MDPQNPSDLYDVYYFATGCGRPYRRDEKWLRFFDSIADRIARDIRPSTVLDVGCAMGFLVEALRKRGVEAFGVDISEYAIQNVHPDIQPYCWVGSATEPFPRKYDLIVCVEVLEHLPPREAEQAVENLCQHSDDILFSSTPFDYEEPTHCNVQPPEYWAELFARYGFFRDVDFDASFTTPWAVRFRRTREPIARVIAAYERRFWQLLQENRARREFGLEQRKELAEKEHALQALKAQLAGKKQRSANPKVSVIIPVFNGAKYLAEALQSVFAQTWQDYEVIVVDDGSTDDSMEICKQFPDVRIIHHQENRGQSAARNTGVRHAKGEYIAFLDQDDRWYPEKLARQVPILEKGPTYGMVYSNADQIDENGRIVIRNVLDILSVQPKKSIMDCLGSDMFILPGTVLIRKSVFEQVGGFDERLSGYEDDDLFSRVFQTTRIYYIRDSLLQWRIYPASYSYSERMDRSRKIYVQKLIEEYPDQPGLGHFYIRDYIAPRFVRVYLNLYSLSLRQGNTPSQPKYYRDEIAALLPYLRHRNLFIYLVAHLPVAVTKMLQKLWRRMPNWVQSQLWRGL